MAGYGNSNVGSTEGWDPYPFNGFVQFNLIPIESPNQENRNYRLVNIADGNRELGILNLNPEEVRFFMARVISEDQQAKYYQTWLRERMINPTKYALNGKMLSKMSVSERITALNSAYNAGQGVNMLTNSNEKILSN